MPRDVRSPLLGAAICAIAFILLALAAYFVGPVRDLDLDVVRHFEYADGPAVAVAETLVHLGDLGALLLLAAAIAALGLSLDRPRQTAAALTVVAGSNLTTQAIKPILEHARHVPWEPGLELPPTNPFPAADSFPSGHTTAAASIAVALLLVVPARHRTTAAVAGLMLTAAVGFSVVVLNWHYPTDVLGALLVVAAWGFIALAGLRLAARRSKAPGAIGRATVMSND
jgi:membrane-associated phospholipid phosphatase